MVHDEEDGFQMRHPVSRAFDMHWRAYAASPLPGTSRAADSALAPWTDHYMVLTVTRAGAQVRSAGSNVNRMIARSIVGQPFAWLFREQDRADLERVIASVASERVACLVAAGGPGHPSEADDVEIVFAPLPDQSVGATFAVLNVQAGETQIRGDLSMTAIRYLHPDRVTGSSGRLSRPQSLPLATARQQGARLRLVQGGRT
jgi:hypothetical protein